MQKKTGGRGLAWEERNNNEVEYKNTGERKRCGRIPSARELKIVRDGNIYTRKKPH